MWRFALALAAWLAVPASAVACLGSNFHQGIVYDDIPTDTPPDAVILDVVFDQSLDGWFMRPAIVDAQVRRVVRGHFEGDTVRVEIAGSPFVFGTQGLIIGAVHNGRLVGPLDTDSPLLRRLGSLTRGEDGVWFEPIKEMVDDRIRRRGVVADFDRDGQEDRAILHAARDEAILEVTLTSRAQPITIWRGNLDDGDRLYVAAGSEYEDECFQMWRCRDDELKQRTELVVLRRWGSDDDMLFKWDGDSFATTTRE